MILTNASQISFINSILAVFPNQYLELSSFSIVIKVLNIY